MVCYMYFTSCDLLVACTPVLCHASVRIHVAVQVTVIVSKLYSASCHY